MSTRAPAPLCAALATVGVLVGALLLSAPARPDEPDDRGSPVLVSGRSFVDRAGRPFVWLADDAGDLLGALNRSEVARYLDARAAQGFTVVRASLDVPLTQYGDAPFADGRPVTTPGADPADDAQYDFWDHLDHVVAEAAARGLAVAVEPGPDGYGPARGVVRAGPAELTAVPAGACAGQAPATDGPAVAGGVDEEAPRCTGGRASAADVRAAAWSAALGGAAGYTYGHPVVREFLGGWTADGQRRGDWVDALDAPAADQVRHLSALLESRPGLVADPGAGPPTTAAAYSGDDDEVTLDLGELAGEVRIWWFDPRTGEAVELGRAEGGGPVTLPVPDPGRDWAVVADDADVPLPEPGDVGGSEGVDPAGDGAERSGADAGPGEADGAGREGEGSGQDDAGESGDGDGAGIGVDRGDGEGAAADGEDGAGGDGGAGDAAGGDGVDSGAAEGGSGEDGARGDGVEGGAGDDGADDGADDGSGGDGDSGDGVDGGTGDEAGDDGADDDAASDDLAGADGASADGVRADGASEDGAGADGALDGMIGANGVDPDAEEGDAAEDAALAEAAPPAEEPEPAPEPEPAAEPVADGATWDRLAQCESSGDWSINTGNGYYGGLQFDEATWGDYGGTEFAPRADRATREQQIEVAVRVRDDRGGYGSWPACARKLGLPR